MSSFQFSKHNTIAITAVDRWLGNTVARGLLCDTRKSQLCIQALTQNPHNCHVRELEKYGADICKIDYERPESLCDCLSDAQVIVFVSESDKNRVDQARAMAKAAKAAKVEGAIILSVEGAGQSDCRTQRDFHEIEKIWQDSNLDCVVVLRLSFIQQGFFLWSYGVQETGKWLWLPKEKERFTPVNLHDIVTSIRCLVTYKDEFVPLDKKHHRKIYLLTGPDSISGSDVVDINNKAIRGEGEVGLKKVDRREMESYLKRLDKDDERDLGLAQRTAAQFLHCGFACLHESFSELIKGNECNLENGVRAFNDGIDFLERAINLSEDDEFENQRTRNMNSKNKFDMRTSLRQLRNNRIERIFNLTPEERAIYLDELNTAIDQIQSRATANIGSLSRSDERLGNRECYPAPFLPLEEIEVELVVDILEYINTGKAGKTTNDVKKITGSKPEMVDSFFKRNYKEFVPEHRRRSRQDDRDISNDQGYYNRSRHSRL